MSYTLAQAIAEAEASLTMAASYDETQYPQRDARISQGALRAILETSRAEQETLKDIARVFETPYVDRLAVIYRTLKDAGYLEERA